MSAVAAELRTRGYCRSMLRHVVLLKFTDEATDADVQAIIEGLEGLPAIIPEIESYSVGVDAGISEGNVSFAIVGEFADAAAYEVYAQNSVHLDVIATRIKPFVAQRTAVQYEV